MPGLGGPELIILVIILVPIFFVFLKSSKNHSGKSPEEKSSVQKKSPEELCSDIASSVIAHAKVYNEKFPPVKNKYGNDPGAELIYVLLYYIDKILFAQLGPSGRDLVFDRICVATCLYYTKIKFKHATQELTESIIEQMVNTQYSRAKLYSQCSDDVGINRGSVIFAFSFCVHRTLGLTNRQDEEILWTKNNGMEIKISELDDFPNPPTLFENVDTFVNALVALDLKSRLSQLS